MSKLNDSTEKYFFNYLKEHNNFLTDQEYHLIAHKAAQIPDTFIVIMKSAMGFIFLNYWYFLAFILVKLDLILLKLSKLLRNKIYIQKN